MSHADHDIYALRMKMRRQETLTKQLLEDNQSMRERIVSLENEVREVRAHIRRQDRHGGSGVH